MLGHCHLNNHINYKVGGALSFVVIGTAFNRSMQDKQHVLMNRYTVVGDESDYELNTKIEIKYNIVCYKFYDNLKYTIL